jgi:hypothetical protein
MMVEGFFLRREGLALEQCDFRHGLYGWWRMMADLPREFKPWLSECGRARKIRREGFNLTRLIVNVRGLAD